MSTEIRFNYDDVLLAKDNEGKEYYLGIYHENDYPFDWSQDEDPVGRLITWHRYYSIGEKHNLDSPEDLWQDLIRSQYGYSMDTPNEETKKKIPEFCRLILDYSDAYIEEDVDDEEPISIYYLRHKNKDYRPYDYELSTNDPDKFNDEDESCFWDILDYLTEKELRKIVDNIPDIIYSNVYMYDHSGIALSLSNSTYPFNDRWDAGLLGFWSCTKEEAKKAGYDTETDDWKLKVLELMEGRIEEFNNVECGNVWGFAYAPVDDFKEVDDVEELRNSISYYCNACWGFVGDYEDRIKDYCEGDGLTITGVLED